MNKKDYDYLDIVEMKKPHACQTNLWQIMRMGADIRINCLNCNHLVTMTRYDFNKKLKKVVQKHEEK